MKRSLRRNPSPQCARTAQNPIARPLAGPTRADTRRCKYPVSSSSGCWDSLTIAAIFYVTGRRIPFGDEPALDWRYSFHRSHTGWHPVARVGRSDQVQLGEIARSGLSSLAKRRYTSKNTNSTKRRSKIGHYTRRSLSAQSRWGGHPVTDFTYNGLADVAAEPAAEGPPLDTLQLA